MNLRRRSCSRAAVSGGWNSAPWISRMPLRPVCENTRKSGSRYAPTSPNTASGRGKDEESAFYKCVIESDFGNGAKTEALVRMNNTIRNDEVGLVVGSKQGFHVTSLRCQTASFLSSRSGDGGQDSFQLQARLWEGRGRGGFITNRRIPLQGIAKGHGQLHSFEFSLSCGLK